MKTILVVAILALYACNDAKPIPAPIKTDSIPVYKNGNTWIDPNTGKEVHL